jgi:oligoendopeptidase F
MKNLKTNWDLSLFYKSHNDPKIEKDLRQIEKMCVSFASAYKNRTDYLKSEKALARALSRYEKLGAVLDGTKPIIYFHYVTALNSSDSVAEAALNKMSLRLADSTNKLLFFDLKLGQTDKKTQSRFLKSKILSPYRYFLKRIFETSRYNLTEPEEKILNLKSLPARALWTQGADKLQNAQTVKFQGKEIPMAAAMSLVSNLPLKSRRKLHYEIVSKLKSISHFAESEINALYIDKKINDGLRGYKDPYQGTVLGYENDLKTVLNLVDSVTKNFKISHQFYKLKAKMLKVPYLSYADRAASVGSIEAQFSFEDCVEILRKAFGKLGDQYLEVLDRMLAKGQIDVYPKKGKDSGAFCSSSSGNPTMVFLNHTSNFNSVKTFGHEMGHAIHAEFSKKQRPLYQGHTISVAEVASTLFENFVFEEIFDKLSPREKVVALHNRINDEIGTVFRQIACFNWELEMHREIRAKGSITKEEISKLHNKHMESYIGKIARMKEEDGYYFVTWSHIRRHFYVYSYAYGSLISSAIYARVKANPNYMKEVEKFLSAGGSKSPAEIFKDMGIDTAKPEFFLEGLKNIEKDIKQLEQLVKQFK